jgi:transcriptional regulator with XRE-family HTH domain
VSKHTDNLFGNYMRDIRKFNGLSIEEVALNLHIEVNILKNWESGFDLPPESISDSLCPLYRIYKREWFEILSQERERRSFPRSRP